MREEVKMGVLMWGNSLDVNISIFKFVLVIGYFFVCM